MPLLMVKPVPGRLPPEADVPIPAGSAAIVAVKRGQLLSVEAPDGGQVAALFAWVAGSDEEWLSAHHTRVFGGTFRLRMGTRMVTNRRRPMFVLGRDSLRRHDLLLPASTATVDAVEAAVPGTGIAVPRIPDPVNLFLDADLGADGRITVRPCPARPGERWTARCLIDAIVAVAACPAGVPEANSVQSRPLRVRVTNLVDQLPQDLALFTG